MMVKNIRDREDEFIAADGAVHVAGEPVFCEDAGLQGGAFVALNQGGVEG